jgi:hypothetical protein
MRLPGSMDMPGALYKAPAETPAGPSCLFILTA